MPGLFGVIDTAAASERRDRELASIARRMAAAMACEPSYAATVVACPAAGAWLGRVELRDGHGTTVTRNTDGVVVTTAGEAAGIPPSRGSLVDVVSALDGRCAALIVDERTGECVALNDRYGRERLFMHVDGDRVFVASEAKAILAVAPSTRALDLTGLAELLACGCTLGMTSLFSGIEVLEPGTIVTIVRSSVSRRRYTTPADLEGLSPVGEAEFFDGFREALRAAVAAAVGATPKAGVSLTGGLDSRMVMASLDAPRGSVPCYTFGSMYRTTGDVAVARQVAARCGQPHAVIELGPAFLSSFPEYVERAAYISDGYLGLSGAAELYVNQQARSIATARMTGNWGGELMRGVRAFKYGTPRGGFIRPELAATMRQSEASFRRVSANPLSAALFQQLPYQGYGRYAIERSQLAMRSPFLADDVVKWLYRAPAAVRESEAAAAAVIRRRPELLSIPTDRGLLGDRSSFARRTSRRVLIKAEYMTSHGAPDWLARVASNLPAPLLERRFLGVDKFQHFRYWSRRDLAGYIRETLSAGRNLPDCFDRARVSRMVDDHIAGRANYTDEIDKLLTIVLIGKTLFAPAASADRAGVVMEIPQWEALKA